MKAIAIILSLSTACLVLGGCATGGTGDVEYENPDNLRTQERMQEAQSRILRRNI